MISKRIVHTFLPLYKVFSNTKFLKDIKAAKLKSEMFDRFIQQDLLYMQSYRQSLLYIAEKSVRAKDRSEIEEIAYRSHSTIRICTEYLNKYQLDDQCQKSPICAGYSQHLIDLSRKENPVDFFAAALPCVLFYRLLSSDFQKIAQFDENTRYFFWIDELRKISNDKSNSSFMRLSKILDATYQFGQTNLVLLENCAKKSASYECKLFDECSRFDNKSVGISKVKENERYFLFSRKRFLTENPTQQNKSFMIRFNYN